MQTSSVLLVNYAGPADEPETPSAAAAVGALLAVSNSAPMVELPLEVAVELQPAPAEPAPAATDPALELPLGLTKAPDQPVKEGLQARPVAGVCGPYRCARAGCRPCSSAPEACWVASAASGGHHLPWQEHSRAVPGAGQGQQVHGAQEGGLLHLAGLQAAPGLLQSAVPGEDDRPLRRGPVRHLLRPGGVQPRDAAAGGLLRQVWRQLSAPLGRPSSLASSQAARQAMASARLAGAVVCVRARQDAWQRPL